MSLQLSELDNRSTKSPIKKTESSVKRQLNTNRDGPQSILSERVDGRTSGMSRSKSPGKRVRMRPDGIKVSSSDL